MIKMGLTEKNFKHKILIVFIFLCPLLMNFIWLLLVFTCNGEEFNKKTCIDNDNILIAVIHYFEYYLRLQRTLCFGLPNSLISNWIVSIIISTIITVLNYYLNIYLRTINNYYFLLFINFFDPTVLLMFIIFLMFKCCSLTAKEEKVNEKNLDKLDGNKDITISLTRNKDSNSIDLEKKYVNEITINNNKYLLYYIILTCFFLENEDSFCFFFTFLYKKLKWPFSKIICYPILYLGWFCMLVLTKLTLIPWKIKMNTTYCIVILTVYFYYFTYYRILIIDHGALTLKEAICIIIENLLCEILFFYFPITDKFVNFCDKYPRMAICMGFSPDKEIIRKMTTKNYLVRQLAVIWSLLGAIIEILTIYISGKSDYFPSLNIQDINEISTRIIFLCVVESISFSIIEICLRKYYSISAWNNISILITGFDEALICILSISGILQSSLNSSINLC